MVQLALEYDPAPPYDSGSPESASPALLAAYAARAERLAPDRGAQIAAAAYRLNFKRV